LEKIALIVAGKEAISSIDEYLSVKRLRLRKKIFVAVRRGKIGNI